MGDNLPVQQSDNRGFTRLKRLSGWRRVAVGMWGRPSDPTIYGELDLNVEKVLLLMKKIRETYEVKISPMHVFLKSVGDMFREYPDFNVMLRRNRFYQRATADVFLQVAIKEGKGDLGGIKIAQVDRKTLVDLTREIFSRAERVRARQDKDLERTKRSMSGLPPFLMPFAVRLTDILSNDLGINLSFVGLKPDAWGGAMVTNIGSFGLQHGYAPLVPATRTPAVFAVGAIRDMPVAVDGQVVVKPMMKVTGTFDHRIFDGFQVAKIVNHVVDRFENPEWMWDELQG